MQWIGGLMVRRWRWASVCHSHIWGALQRHLQPQASLVRVQMLLEIGRIRCPRLRDCYSGLPSPSIHV